MLVSRRADLGDAGLRRLLQVQARQFAEQGRAELGQQAQRDLEYRENAACRAAVRPALRAWLAAGPTPTVPVDEVLHLVLPSGPRRQRPLAQRRRERYRRHLQHSLALLMSAPAADAVAPVPVPAPVPARPADPGSTGPPWAASLCGVCRGGCCPVGGDTAFLDATTLQRFMHQHPELGPDQVVAHYLSRLPAASMAGSCINHTRQGCSLPRAMRSDVCNVYRCGPLALLQAPGQPVQAVLVIQRRRNLWRTDNPTLDNGIIGATLLDAGGAVPLHPRCRKSGPD